jgi:hypothetical protein
MTKSEAGANLLCPFLRDRWLHGSLSNNAGKMVLVTSARKGAFLLSLYPSQFGNSCCFALKVRLRFHHSSRRRHNQRPSTSSHHPGQQPRNNVRTRRQIGTARWDRLTAQQTLLNTSPRMVRSSPEVNTDSSAKVVGSICVYGLQRLLKHVAFK